jgi:FAD-linked sulfhydryl oxidase
MCGLTVRSGECAEHFGHVLAKYPPQVSSRTAAVMWGCFVHNVVNKRLNKAEFDCKDIGDAYDCGCGDDEPESSSKDAPA